MRTPNEWPAGMGLVMRSMPACASCCNSACEYVKCCIDCCVPTMPYNGLFKLDCSGVFFRLDGLVNRLAGGAGRDHIDAFGQPERGLRAPGGGVTAIGEHRNTRACSAQRIEAGARASVLTK